MALGAPKGVPWRMSTARFAIPHPPPHKTKKFEATGVALAVGPKYLQKHTRKLQKPTRKPQKPTRKLQKPTRKLQNPTRKLQKLTPRSEKVDSVEVDLGRSRLRFCRCM